MRLAALPGGRHTTSVVDVACVEGNTATLVSGALRAALEIDPINFLLQDDEGREGLWHRYRQLLTSLGAPISIYMWSRPLGGGIGAPGAGGSAEPAPAECDRRFADHLVASHRVQLQRHLVVVWPGPVPRVLHPWHRQPTASREQTDLDRRCDAVLAGLERIGLRGRRLDQGGWFALLQECCGGRSGRWPADFRSWLAPSRVTVEPDRLVVDRRICRSLQVSGFPRRVHMGWLAALLLSPPCGLRLAEHIYPMPKLATLSHLRRRIRSFETSLQVDHLRGRRPDQGTRSALGDALELEERVLLEEERLFGLGLTLTLEAQSEEELESGWSWVSSALAEIGCTTTPTTHRQVDGWRTTVPLGADPMEWRRDMTAGALATAIPFVRAGLAGSDGALLGPSLISRELVFVDPFSRQNPNFNVLVLGTSGAGKSFTAKLLSARLCLRGVRLRCVDPAGEYRELAGLLGGEFTELGRTAGGGLNPLGPALHTPDERAAELRAFQVLPILERLASTSGDALDDSSLEQMEVALLAVLREDRGEACLQHLIDALSTAGAHTLAARLRRLTIGVEQGLFDGRAKFAGTHFSAISLRELRHDRDRLLTALVQLALVYLESELEQRRGIAHLLVVDEAEVLLDSERSAKSLERLTRRLRKFGAGLVVVSQVVEDFLESPVGNVVIRNCHTKLLLRQEPVAIPAVRKAFGLSAREAEMLGSCEPGCGLVLVGGEHAAFRGAAPTEWLLALTTNALAEDAGAAT